MAADDVTTGDPAGGGEGTERACPAPATEAHPALVWLQESHRELERRIERLDALVLQARTGGLTAADLDPVEEIVRFLEADGLRHERDEEDSLFPRLPDEPELTEAAAILTAQHRVHQQCNESLRAILGSLRARGPSWALSSQLARTLDPLPSIYRTHIEMEDARILPAARELDAEVLDAIEAEMRARRGG